MKITQLALAAALLAAGAYAEEIVFFQSSTAGEKAWTWGAAKVNGRSDGSIVITENSPTNTAGDAYVSDHLPYVPSGTVVFDVSEAPKGDYTLQVLSFKGKTHFHTATSVNHIKEAKQSQFALNSLNIPEAAESIVFKVWVAGVKGAQTVVHELRYSAEVDAGKAVLDERFQDSTAWETDSNKVVLAVAEGAPAKLSLLPGATNAAPKSVTNSAMRGASYGSITYTTSFNREPGEDILLHVTAAEKGAVVTLQLNALDATGVFVGAIDLITDVASGYYAANLDQVKWPQGTVSFNPKIWISGKDVSCASLDRLMILRR